jgi:hypothetical protein
MLILLLVRVENIARDPAEVKAWVGCSIVLCCAA